MHEIITATDRAATARAASLALHAYDLAWRMTAEKAQEEGVAVPSRLFDSPKDVGPAGESEEIGDEIAEDDRDCGTCGGSGGGEGYWQCQTCAGRGYMRGHDEDAETARADYEFDRAKDERMDREVQS